MPSAAVVAGNRVTEIARAEGVSRQYASQEVHAPQPRQYILDQMERHYAQVEGCFVEAGCASARLCTPGASTS